MTDEPKFKVGDVIRHRLSGELAVIVFDDDGGIEYVVSWGFGEDKETSEVWLRECCEVIGHIRDKRWDYTPPLVDSSDLEKRYGLPPGSMLFCKDTTAQPDPAMPRRFRWKQEMDAREVCVGFGVYWPNSGLHHVYGNDRGRVDLPANCTITEWIDPKPEGKE